MSNNFARRVRKMADDTVVNTLKLASQPGIISLGGGLPNPDLFPVEFIRETVDRLIKENSHQVLQYGPTPGLPVLRASIASYLSQKWGRAVKPEQVLITTGSQQALDLVGKAFLDKSDWVLVENPSYLAALLAFNGYEVKYDTLQLKPGGIDSGELEKKLRSGKKYQFAYFIPTFQNPTGVTWNESVRRQTLALAKQHGLMIIEDDPYGELYFQSVPPASLAALDQGNTVIYLGTFSKTFCPGLRVGYLVADENTVATLTLIKQAMDLHSPSLSQALVAEYLQDQKTYHDQMEKIRVFYREKVRFMMKEMEKQFKNVASWTKPAGGLFTWMTVPGIDSRTFYHEAIKAGVSFMPGYPFYANRPDYSTLRLTFATVGEEQMKIALERLKRLIKRS
ncbi:PLP-dependent aminotransferase family protein [Patescibacteria group bacterium]|nr:PLP-dependent aminotransferase family protein [Patescibacteria group bacterium]MCL5091585.1 PLP-dependent aminotransferase family protein [Patescibacteria group bacterium]